MAPSRAGGEASGLSEQGMSEFDPSRIDAHGTTTENHSEASMDEQQMTPPQASGEDIMDVLAEFETGLDSLKALYSQRQRLQTRIRQHEEEVATRDAAVTQRAAELERANSEHQQRREELDRAQESLSVRERELSGLSEELAKGQEQLRESRQKLDEESTARNEAMEAHAHKLAEEARQVEQLTAEVQEQSRLLSEARATFEKERQERVSSEWAQIEALQRDLAAERERLATAETQCRALTARVEELSTQLGEAKRQVQAIAAAGEKADAKASRERGVLLEKVRECEQALATGTGERAALSAQVKQRDRALSEAEQAHAALSEQLRQLELAAAEAATGVETRARELADLHARGASLERQIDQERVETVRLTAAFEDKQRETARLEEAVEGLKSKLRMELNEREDMRVQLEAAKAGLLQTSTRASQLEEQLAKAASELAQLQQQAKARKAQPPTASAASTLRRKRRLKRAHELIREQSAKLRRASEAMKKRIEQADQVISLRAELAGVRDRVIQSERRGVQKQAGGKAAVMTLCAAAVFSVLAALSWTAAKEIAPATFVATSKLQADGRGRELNEAEKGEWQHFHESLLEDPRFHETAADRFKKQGMTALASASAVAETIRTSVTTESTTPGELSLHFKGQGSDRTQRTLETLTAAFASHANAAQQQRLDGSVTQVAQPSISGVDPMDNTRQVYAGGMLGAGVLVGGALWAFLWKRLAGAKTAFEQDPELMAALDDARWASFASSGAVEQLSKNKAARG